MRITRGGVTVDVPPGWDASITRRSTTTPGAVRRSTVTADNVLLHAANFALPPGRGDYGSVALDRMGPDGVFLSLMELGPVDPDAALFAGGGVRLPRLDVRDFSPSHLQRPQRDQTGGQWFVRLAGRPFGLFVVLGAHDRRAALVPVAQRLLTGVGVR